MKINLSPQRRDDTLSVYREDEKLIVNGEIFDFSKMSSGDTLPASAIDSEWFVKEVDNLEGEIELTLLLPLPQNYSHSQAFPLPLLNVSNGEVNFPEPLPDLNNPIIPTESFEQPIKRDNIDWSKLITKAMKEKAEADKIIIDTAAEISRLRSLADYAISPLQDAVDLDDATDAEVAALKAWKKYRVALSRVSDQPGYPGQVEWPISPADA